MQSKIAKTILSISCILVWALTIIPILFSASAQAATSFGTDYRHLTTVSPGATPDTTITIAVNANATGTFIVDPLTSGSTAAGTPSTSALSGFGWRTAGVVGSSIPAGTWSFNVTTQSDLTSALAVGKVKVFAYSADTLGSTLSSIGSATGTTNVFALLAAQTETITFSAPSVDLTNGVLVVEYWIDVTTGPLLATTLTFQAASSNQTVALPSSSGTFYLGKASLFSIGESESGIVSDTLSRTIASARGISDSTTPSDSPPLRTINASRSISESSGAVLSDSTSKFTNFVRDLSETSEAVVIDTSSRFTNLTRQVSETTGAISNDTISRVVSHLRQVSDAGAVIGDGLLRFAEYSRMVSETSEAVMSDSVSKSRGYTRNVTESSGAVVSEGVSRITAVARGISQNSFISDLVIRILDAINPPSSGGGRGGGGGGGGGFFIPDEPSSNEPPPVQNDTGIRNRHLNVRVSDNVEVRADNILDIKEPQQNVTLSSEAWNLTISVKENDISPYLLPVPPSAIGSFNLEIVNNANNTEQVAFSYWCIEERTGLIIAEGNGDATLSAHQFFSKTLDIRFNSPGLYSLGASATGVDDETSVMKTLQINVSWISVYLVLLLICIAASLFAIDIYTVVHRRSSKAKHGGWSV